MGLLKSISKAFVEEVPIEKHDEIIYTEGVYPVEETPNAELDNVNVDTLIEDIYAQNNLSDKSQSIFKVEELIASLPQEMVTETKRTSVLAILGSFNLTATDVITDGEDRVKILSSIKEQINEENKILVAEKEAQIEELKKSIASLTIEISEEQEKTRVSNESITKEVETIESLIKFVGGVN